MGILISQQDVLFFGVATEKNVHLVLKFDLYTSKLTVRESDKGGTTVVRFGAFAKVRSEPSENLLQVDLRSGETATLSFWSCYNDVDFSNIVKLCQKIISCAADLVSYALTLKPSVCLALEKAFLKKSLSASSEVRFVLIDRAVVVHSTQDDFPLFFVPLLKRPCFTTGKTGVRFDLKKKSVDIFFETEELRESMYSVVALAASKAATEWGPIKARVEALVQMSETAFYPYNAHQFDFARRLWDATVAKSHPNEKLPPSAESHLWKEVLGSSSTSLAADLKSSNVLGLVALVHFVETYPEALEEILAIPDHSLLPSAARITWVLLSLLDINNKKFKAWYPTEVVFPFWTYNLDAFETLVSVGLRLLYKKMRTASERPEACLNQLVTDFTETLKRPPSSEGMPYVFSMFLVLLPRAVREPKRT